ncbi:uncharacterized protein LOC129151151 [Eptesicus fuscus]|uniref:uncharacterized protein LOC129151151 n=1 Tax=Eptesicus fuscus TaxID=29078 RepID=UPI002403EABF|nr:uncharacterized protein LOC129151151 [Eptesicus fuscus]
MAWEALASGLGPLARMLPLRWVGGQTGRKKEQLWDLPISFPELFSPHTKDQPSGGAQRRRGERYRLAANNCLGSNKFKKVTFKTLQTLWEKTSFLAQRLRAGKVGGAQSRQATRSVFKPYFRLRVLGVRASELKESLRREQGAPGTPRRQAVCPRAAAVRGSGGPAPQPASRGPRDGRTHLGAGGAHGDGAAALRPPHPQQRRPRDVAALPAPRGRERDKELETSMREKHRSAASCTPPTGDVPATKVHALDRNRTWDPSVRRLMLYPLSQTGQGKRTSVQPGLTFCTWMSSVTRHG